MSADILRRAASMMRERAEADGSSGWRVENGNEGTEYHPLWMVANDAYHNPPADEDEPWLAVEVHTGTKATAEHIASWHPAVALAVADWLDTAGADLWAHGPLCECGSSCHACDDVAWQPHVRRALAAARAYLGEDE